MEKPLVNPYIQACEIAQCTNGIVQAAQCLHISAKVYAEEHSDKTFHFLIDAWCNKMKFNNFLLLKTLRL